MKRTICGFIAAIGILCFAGAGLADGIPGATDKVKAATLLVPFFEVGVDVSTHPIDTLLNLNNVHSSIKIHYHVWDIDGNALGLYGNVDVSTNGSWSASMRALISSASSGVKSALTDGDFYRGFVTIDVVTADTTKNPTESGYPFGTGNYIEGYIYYVRLTEGSSNSMTMIPLEYVGNIPIGLNYLDGFYTSTDGREEIDVTARACAAALLRDESCAGHENISRLQARVFLNPSPSLNATTRIIIFLWQPGTTEGISDWCDSAGCDTTYTYNRYNESGSLVEHDTDFSLDHVVNVIDVSGTENGWVSIWDIPGGYDNSNWQVYAFSITNAKPASGATNWDAILEAYINP